MGRRDTQKGKSSHHSILENSKTRKGLWKEELLLNGVVRRRNFEQWLDRAKVQECDSRNIWGQIIPSGESGQ